MTEGGELIADIPTGTDMLYIDVVIALNEDIASRDEYARVRSALLTARAKVIVETDLPGRALLESTLQDARDVPGEVQRCSPT